MPCVRAVIETTLCPQLIAVFRKLLDEALEGALEEYELVVDFGLGDAFLAGACSCGACTKTGSTTRPGAAALPVSFTVLRGRRGLRGGRCPLRRSALRRSPRSSPLAPPRTRACAPSPWVCRASPRGRGRGPPRRALPSRRRRRSEEHTSELQSRQYLVCRLLLEKKKNKF